MELRPALSPGPAAPMETWIPMLGTTSGPPAHILSRWPLSCLSAGVTCCNLVLLLMALLSPRWLLIGFQEDGYHSGLWWLCTQPECTSIVTETPSFKAIRTLMLLVLLSSGVAVSSLLIPSRSFARWRVSRFLVSAVANFIAGLLVLVGVVVFTTHVMLDAVNPQARASFEWAFFLAWTLSPLFILSGILCLFVHSHLPAPSPHVGPQGQPGQNLEEMPVQGRLEEDFGAKPLPQGQKMPSQGGDPLSQGQEGNFKDGVLP